MAKVTSRQIDTGTTANKVVELDGSGNYPASDGSAISNVDAITVSGESATDFHDGAQLTGSIADARITASSVTQHEAALSIAGSQLTGTVDADTLGGQPVGTTANDIVALDASSKLPAVDGSQLTNLPSSGGGLIERQIFTNNGTWTKPANFSFAVVTVVGGGGGGAGAQSSSASNSRAGGGGSSGGGVQAQFTDAQSNATENISMFITGMGGNGGASGNNNGNDGDYASFGTSGSGRAYIKAEGGKGGIAGDTDNVPGIPASLANAPTTEVVTNIIESRGTAGRIPVTTSNLSGGGNGGTPPFSVGSGGNGTLAKTSAVGVSAGGQGRSSGGGGGLSHLTTASAGGATAPRGIVIVDSYA